MDTEFVSFGERMPYNIDILIQQSDFVNHNRCAIGGGRHSLNFCDVISVENLFAAWKKFSKGKRSHPDVAAFELRLEKNLFSLHERLAQGTWVNDSYVCKRIADPKPRIIHIASVRDRVLYQAVYQQLYQVFNKMFIHDSYASRVGKGTHAGVKRFAAFARKVSANYTEPAFVLKCDIRKFFDHIDHEILFSLLSRRVTAERLLALLRGIISSFATAPGKGLPLGNVTSQLFANVYLNELDQFVKHALKTRYYIRYCDDFVVLESNRALFDKLVWQIQDFLQTELFLELHPNKMTIRKMRQGMDFLGYVSLPHYRVLRTRTKRRMLKRLAALSWSIQTKNDFRVAFPVIQSYLGLLIHCMGRKVRGIAEKLFEKWL